MKIVLIFFLFLRMNLYAGEIRFISLRNDETNVRLGPSLDYPIKFVYKAKNIPIQVIGEYDNWYKIKDKDGEEGWLNRNLTIKKRHLLVIDGTQIIYRRNSVDSAPIFRVEEDVPLEFKKCDGEWCKVELNNKIGWIQKKVVYGY